MGEWGKRQVVEILPDIILHQYFCFQVVDAWVEAVEGAAARQPGQVQGSLSWNRYSKDSTVTSTGSLETGAKKEAQIDENTRNIYTQK